MVDLKKSNLTVYVVDDDAALCQSLSWLLESVGLPVETFNSAQAYLEKYNVKQRGCLLLDIRMKGMSGFELQEKLISLGNRLPIIMITGHGDIPMAVRAMKAGAVDFITKPFNDQLLLDLVQRVLAEEIERKEEADVTVTSNANNPELLERYASLTAREREIMERVVDGKLNKQIAYELGISMKTVELHRAHVMQKMQVKSLAELVKACMQLERV